METPESKTESAQNLTYVGFWKRTLAGIIDWMILAVITMPMLFLIYGTEEYLQHVNSGDNAFAGAADFFLTFVFPAAVVIILWVRFSATPGKMATRAKIVDARTGKPPSPGQCIGRYFAYFPSIIAIGLGFLWIAFDPRKQGWHDKLAGTVVVAPRHDVEEVRFESAKQKNSGDKAE